MTSKTEKKKSPSNREKREQTKKHWVILRVTGSRKQMSHTHCIRSPKEKDEVNLKGVFEEIMAENNPNLIKRHLALRGGGSHREEIPGEIQA